MFSRILIKLIDEAILPAVMLVAARILGVLFVAGYFEIPFSSGKSFFTLYFSKPSDFLIVNSYSILFMYLVIFLGGLFFLVKSKYLHDSHVHPSFAAKLFSMKLGSFIQTSFDIYSQGTIWLSYSYLMTLMLGVEAYYKMVFLWVFLASFILSILLTLIFVFDVEKELTIAKNEKA